MIFDYRRMTSPHTGECPQTPLLLLPSIFHKRIPPFPGEPFPLSQLRVVIIIGHLGGRMPCQCLRSILPVFKRSNRDGGMP